MFEMSEDHENFELDKKIDDDQTVGLPNNKDILCANCNVLLIEEGVATKVLKPVSYYFLYTTLLILIKLHSFLQIHLIKNNLREYDLVNHYWHV